MMPPRLETVELTIQHVRNGGKRMPVVRVHMGAGPLNPFKCEACCDPWIFINVLFVVEVNELMPESLAEDDPDNSRKENRDDTSDNAVAPSVRKMALSCAASHSSF